MAQVTVARRMRLKSTWSDGTTAKIFEGKDAMAKLAMLIPAPNTNVIRYVGVFSAHHRWREAVVPAPAAKTPACQNDQDDQQAKRSTKKRRDAHTWADLMRRGFSLDVLSCECGGRREVIALIEDVDVARRILKHLRLPAEAVVFRPPRPPPPSCALRYDCVSEQDDWDCVDVLVDEERFSQAVAQAVAS